MYNVNDNLQTENAARKRGISGFDLKIIAMISMAIDHFAVVVLERCMELSKTISEGLEDLNAVGQILISWIASHQELTLEIYFMLRCIGRMAFPIYCFLLVEGFLHTKNVKKYLLRLGVFALISEIPFDLAVNHTILEIKYNNVFFTLFLGLMGIWGLSYIEQQYNNWGDLQIDPFICKVFKMTFSVIVYISCGFFASGIFASDYGFAGVTAIFAMYIFRKIPILSFGMGVFFLAIFTNASEILALFMLWPISHYRGEKGKGNKYFFYFFYPVHLLIFMLLAFLLCYN